jgi:hypothetical protein
VAIGLADAEVDRDLIDEGGLGQIQAAATEILAGLKDQPISANAHGLTL